MKLLTFFIFIFFFLMNLRELSTLSWLNFSQAANDSIKTEYKTTESDPGITNPSEQVSFGNAEKSLGAVDPLELLRLKGNIENDFSNSLHNRSLVGSSQKDCPLEKLNVPGISCVRSVSGLGGNLQDDPSVISGSDLKRAPHDQIILKYSSYKEVPELLKKKLPLGQFDPKDPVTIFLEISNDNFPFASISALKKYKALNKLGDDYGDTHGLKIGARKTIRLGEGTKAFLGEQIDATFSYETRLYTVPVIGSFTQEKNGNWRGKENYKNQDILQVIFDNIRQGKAYYWKAEAGIISINQRHGVFEGISQQQAFHNLMNGMQKDYSRSYTPVRTPDQDQLGVFAGYTSGIQTMFQPNSRCVIRGFAELSMRGSTLKNTSYFQGTAGGQINYRFGKETWINLGVDQTAQYNSNGKYQETNYRVGFGKPDEANPSVQKNGWALVINTSSGKPTNPTGYDRDNVSYPNKRDPILKLVYTRSF